MSAMDELDTNGIAAKLEALLIESGAYDRDKRLLNVDAVWQSPRVAKEFASCLAQYLVATGVAAKATSILAVDKVRFPFGLMPIAALLSAHLNKPLAVWKESANILTGTPHLFGKVEGTHILLLHDVVVRGLTPLRVILDLHKRHGCAPRTVLSVADAGTESSAGLTAGQFIEKEAKERTGNEVTYMAILRLSAFGGGQH